MGNEWHSGWADEKIPSKCWMTCHRDYKMFLRALEEGLDFEYHTLILYPLNKNKCDICGGRLRMMTPSDIVGLAEENGFEVCIAKDPFKEPKLRKNQLVFKRIPGGTKD